MISVAKQLGRLIWNCWSVAGKWENCHRISCKDLGVSGIPTMTLPLACWLSINWLQLSHTYRQESCTGKEGGLGTSLWDNYKTRLQILWAFERNWLGKVHLGEDWKRRVGSFEGGRVPLRNNNIINENGPRSREVQDRWRNQNRPHISPLNACGACEGEDVDAERVQMRYSGGGELAVYISWVERRSRVIEILFATYQILHEALISSHLTVGSHCMKCNC